MAEFFYAYGFEQKHQAGKVLTSISSYHLSVLAILSVSDKAGISVVHSTLAVQSVCITIHVFDSITSAG